jgi:hypothetical protein
VFKLAVGSLSGGAEGGVGRGEAAGSGHLAEATVKRAVRHRLSLLWRLVSHRNPAAITCCSSDGQTAQSDSVSSLLETWQ